MKNKLRHVNYVRSLATILARVLNITESVCLFCFYLLYQLGTGGRASLYEMSTMHEPGNLLKRKSLA